MSDLRDWTTHPISSASYGLLTFNFYWIGNRQMAALPVKHFLPFGP